MCRPDHEVEFTHAVEVGRRPKSISRSKKDLLPPYGGWLHMYNFLTFGTKAFSVDKFETITIF